jgi:PAS domain S-box-containing protein
LAKLDDEYAVANVRDITEQRKYEEELRLHDEILANMAEGVYLIRSSDGMIVYANSKLEEMVGYGHSELNGKHISVVDAPGEKTPEEVAREIIESLNENGTWIGEVCNITKDGETFWCHATVSTFDHHEYGEIWDSVLTDITERKQAEEAVRRAAEELETRVDERTAELREAQVQIVQQERLRALGEMAAGIAHDFNNALTGVMGHSELLLEQPENLDDKAQVVLALEGINTAARDAADVVRRLVEFYRPLEDTETFALIDLGPLVEQVASFTQPKWQRQARSRGVDIRFETYLREVPLVSGNKAELREVLINQIFNAVDAMAGRGKITVRAYPEGEDAVLSVNDTGTGMTEEVRQRSTEPFFSTKTEGGTDLGLSMAYGIIKRHRGTIQIDSEIGNGTTVSIRLPAQVGQKNGATGTEVAVKPDSLRALAVDDQRVALQIVAGYLAADGHTVDTATNGQEALKKFHAGEFDVVVTDRAMPLINGDQLAGMIKATIREVPVILLTGFGDMIMAKDEKVENVAVIVGKPVTLNALREALVNATANNR